METPYISYKEFKEEVISLNIESKSLFFNEKWVIEAWESNVDKVDSLFDEQFYKEFLIDFETLKYLNPSSLTETPDETTDWDLLLRLLVSSSNIEDYSFQFIDPEIFENKEYVDKTVFWRTPVIKFSFKDLDSDLLSFTNIFDYTEIKGKKHFGKINYAANKFSWKMINEHNELFNNTIELSSLSNMSISFIFKLFIFQLISESLENHFTHGINYPQNKIELVEKFNKKKADFDLKIRKLEIAYKYL